MNKTHSPQKQNPRLSLCMIVKDEAAMLGPCLESVRALTDEIIVVDTGSTDTTVAIAEKFGAKIILQEWQKDFSQARNRSLEHARGDWILFLDADERIDPNSLPLLKEIINANNGVEGYRLQFVNYVGEDADSSSINGPLLRLFRNRGYRFTGKIHEQIEPQVAARGPIQNTPVIVHHLGYLRKIREEKDKGARYVSMLQRELQVSPQDAYLRFQLGSSLVINGCFADALPELHRVFEQYQNQNFQTWPPYAVHTLYLLSRSYYLLGQYPQALYWSHWALQHWEITGILFQHALNQHAVHQHAAALATFQKCLTANPDDGYAYQTSPGIAGHLSLLQIGKVYEFVGDPATAREWYFKAFEKQPQDVDTVYRLVRLITDHEILLSLLRLIQTPSALQAFCFGCAETGHEFTPAILDRLEKTDATPVTLQARLRYLGRHENRSAQVLLLKKDSTEFARFVEFLIRLNDAGPPAGQDGLQSFQAYRDEARAVANAVCGKSAALNASLLVPLTIDLSLRRLFAVILDRLPENLRDEALRDAQRVWQDKFDATEIKSACGVAYDLKTAQALREQDWDQAELLLEKAFEYGNTITRHLYRMELQRQTGATDLLQTTLAAALKEYPGSELLKTIAADLSRVP